MIIWENPSFVLTVFALITNGCIILRIWDFRNDMNVSAAIALYFMFYYGLRMNITRQCMAVAIIFYFTRYIQKKKYKYYYLGVCIAFLIHVSSCVAVIIPLIYLLYYGELKINRNHIKWYIAIGLITGGGFCAYLIYRYAEYFAEIGINIGIMQTVCLVVMLATYLPVFIKYKKNMKLHRRRMKEVESFHLIFGMAFLGTFIAFLGYIVPAAGRIGYGFKIYEIIFYSMILEKKFYTSVVKKVLCVILMFLGIYSLMTYGGIVPYSVI